jgi:hypothetical protein
VFTYEQFEKAMDDATKGLISKEYGIFINPSIKDEIEKLVTLYTSKRPTLIKVVADDVISKNRCYVGDLKEFTMALKQTKRIYGSKYDEL